jgi:hypothetical protein
MARIVRKFYWSRDHRYSVLVMGDRIVFIGSYETAREIAA